MFLTFMIVACGPQEADRAEMEALLASLPQEREAVDAAEQAAQAREVGFPDRAGALSRAGLGDAYET